eukprot:7549156-Ditylum_brightwellii.AAC.1
MDLATSNDTGIKCVESDCTLKFCKSSSSLVSAKEGSIENVSTNTDPLPTDKWLNRKTWGVRTQLHPLNPFCT